jgi:hypothetical protein
MARVASELTKAVRRLCDETNFAITYAQARPKLIALGLPVAAEPSEKSEAYRVWEDHAENRPKNADDLKGWYKATLKAAGLPQSALDEIMAEDSVHHTFRCQRNYFDVTKSNYQRMVGNHGSQKPDNVAKPPAKRPRVSAEPVAVAVRKPKPKVVVADTRSVMADAELITWLVEQGGVSGVNQKIADMKAALDEMSAKLKQATAVISKLSAA